MLKCFLWIVSFIGDILGLFFWKLITRILLINLRVARGIHIYINLAHQLPCSYMRSKTTRGKGTTCVISVYKVQSLKSMQLETKTHKGFGEK